MPTPLEDVERAARDRFGWPSLRPGQLQAVAALLDGEDVLVVMPTGAGKSAVYQLAGLFIDGPTVVVSPLIALQRDQLAGLAARTGPAAPSTPSPGPATPSTGPAARSTGTLDGVAVNSAQRASETDAAWLELQAGDAEFLFLSPEQLARDDVVRRLADAAVSLLVVDEAHCVSSWGHDFRPDYLRIADAVQRLGSPRMVALTATAAPPVREEIVERLGMRSPVQVVQGFDRPNLSLEVVRYTRARHKEQAVAERVAALRGAGIVYAATRASTEAYADALRGRGRSAAAYHAGMRAAEREQVHERFLAGQVDVVVATTAFGMGIDKPDVRFVVHADVAESLDAYYQEIGRAGRDGEPAQALLLYRSQDLGLRAFFASGGTDLDTLTLVTTALHAYPGRRGTPSEELREELSLTHTRLTQAVNLLEQAGAVRVEGAGRVRLTDRRRSVDDAVSAASRVAESHERMDRSRVDMMRGYAETTGCRRQFLLGYFGENLAGPCGNCDTCRSGSALAAAGGAESRFPVNAQVRHRDWGQGVVMRPEPDRVTVLFEDVGYRTLAMAALDADEDLLTLA